MSFDGVTKIVRFNTRYYVLSGLGLIAVVVVLKFLPLPLWLKAALVCAAALIVFWTLSSLLVSWYVYDFARVTHWDWLQPTLHPAPPRWANIHAGLDESTACLRHLLPGTEGVVVDIYDPRSMTEPSIARARRMYPAAEPFNVGSAKSLPLPDSDRDTIFLLFAAHELRDSTRRTQLLREARRVLKHDGRMVLVEHLRDLPNFLAFGPGAFHFHSRRSWLRNIREAGFHIQQQRGVTPFVSCFILRKAEA